MVLSLAIIFTSFEVDGEISSPTFVFSQSSTDKALVELNVTSFRISTPEHKLSLDIFLRNTQILKKIF